VILWAAAIIVQWTLHIAIAMGFAPARPSLDREALRRVVTTGLKLYGGPLFTFLLLRADLFLVNRYLDVEDVGVYSLAVLMAEIVWLTINPLVTAVLPFQVAAERQEAGRLSFKAARFNLAIAVVLAGVFAATGWFAIPAVYGHEFAGAYSALIALMPGMLAMAAARPLSNWLLREGRPLILSALALAAFLLNLALNIVLIPARGIVGASVASSVTYVLLAACLILWAVRVSDLPLTETCVPQPGDAASLRRLFRR
jgi:O-antigen/teichoic acid export membrane protein